MNTYEKRRGAGLLLLTTHPMRMRILSERSESKDLSPHTMRESVLRSIATMTHNKNWRTIIFGTLVAILALTRVSAAQQNQPPLQITSPANNTVVNPGQAVSVSVGSPANLSFKQVFVMGEGAIDTSNIATSVPAQFSMLIPKNMQIGSHLLTAWGTTGAGQMVASIPLTIDVERPDVPTRLSVNPSQVTFQSQGQKLPLHISGTFSDGSVLDVTRSSNLAFAASDTSVASVDKNGIVRAVAKGNASITATYTLGTQSVHVSVFVTVPPPVLTSSPTALSFNNQNVGTSSSAQTLTLTNVSNNQSLKVGPVATAGDFSETDNCAASSPIAVGGMCTANVTFTPAAAGTRTGTVFVADGMDIVPLAMPLSGTGVVVPSITTLSPTSGPVGTSVTIAGANFGATQGTSKVTFNGTTAAPTSWSATSIVATVPTGTTTGSVVVTVGGVASNGVGFTVGIPTPSTTSLNPGLGPAGTSVTITGTNFGTTQRTSIVTFDSLCSLFSPFAQRVFHNSFAHKRFHTLSRNSQVYAVSSQFEIPHQDVPDLPFAGVCEPAGGTVSLQFSTFNLCPEPFHLHCMTRVLKSEMNFHDA